MTLRKNRRVSGFTESLKEIGYQGVRRGDLVIHAMDAFAGAIGVSDSDGKCTPVYAVCQPIGNVNSHYYSYIVREMARSQWIVALAKGIRERSTDFRFDGFASQNVPIPPRQEQDQIAVFIDRIDRRIRRYIRTKQKLIKLLEEQKKAIIHQAVTRGLDPNVRLKPSGVEWLGEVPEQWEIKRIKHLARLRSGDAITSLGINENGDYPVFGGNGLRGFTDKYTHQGEFVLIGRQGALCGNINYAQGLFWASEHAVVAHPIKPYNLFWFGELLRKMNLNQYSISAAQPGLAIERIQNLSLPVPPYEEQTAINKHIKSATSDLDCAISQSLREIFLLREYRTRLIADIVTGKLDLREAAANLPEEIDEMEVLDDESAGDQEIAEEDLEGEPEEET